MDQEKALLSAERIEKVEDAMGRHAIVGVGMAIPVGARGDRATRPEGLDRSPTGCAAHDRGHQDQAKAQSGDE